MKQLSQLPSIWHRAPRRWGHDFHSMCSYLAMFPPAIPHVFVQWLTKAGDVVYDPFSGRGTTVLEACLADRVGLGSDANPLALALTAAKCDPPERRRVGDRLAALARAIRSPSVSRVSDDIAMLFSVSVLKQLVWLRSELDPSDRVDRHLIATLLGILHCNADSSGSPRGLSVAMPNTFAMSPRYVRRYIRTHRLRPPQVDVLTLLAARVAATSFPSAGFRKGRAWQQDVSRPIRFPSQLDQAKLVFTSPPYLQVIKYAKFNWVRHWFLRTRPKVVDRSLFASASLEKYLAFMSGMVANVRPHLRDDGYLCLVVGDVRTEGGELKLADEIVKQCFGESDLNVLGVIRDALPVKHKVSRIWGKRKGRATRTDRIIVAAGPKVRSLPSLPAVDWAAL